MPLSIIKERLSKLRRRTILLPCAAAILLTCVLFLLHTGSSADPTILDGARYTLYKDPGFMGGIYSDYVKADLVVADNDIGLVDGVYNRCENEETCKSYVETAANGTILITQKFHDFKMQTYWESMPSTTISLTGYRMYLPSGRVDPKPLWQFDENADHVEWFTHGEIYELIRTPRDDEPPYSSYYSARTGQLVGRSTGVPPLVISTLAFYRLVTVEAAYDSASNGDRRIGVIHLGSRDDTKQQVSIIYTPNDKYESTYLTTLDFEAKDKGFIPYSKYCKENGIQLLVPLSALEGTQKPYAYEKSYPFRGQCKKQVESHSDLTVYIRVLTNDGETENLIKVPVIDGMLAIDRAETNTNKLRLEPTEKRITKKLFITP